MIRKARTRPSKLAPKALATATGGLQRALAGQGKRRIVEIAFELERNRDLVLFVFERADYNVARQRRDRAERVLARFEFERNHRQRSRGRNEIFLDPRSQVEVERTAVDTGFELGDEVGIEEREIYAANLRMQLRIPIRALDPPTYGDRAVAVYAPDDALEIDARPRRSSDCP
jgi:hypothetical protein